MGAPLFTNTSVFFVVFFTQPFTFVECMEIYACTSRYMDSPTAIQEVHER